MVKAPYEKKEKVVRAKMLPMGFYGCETAPVNETAIQKLRSSIVNALTFVTSRRSCDLTFTVASGKTDLDPDIEVYTR